MLDPKYIPLFLGGFVVWMAFVICVGFFGSRGKREGEKFLATLLLATSTFFTPTPRPDADAAWGKTPEGRRKLLDVVSYNLRLGAEAPRRHSHPRTSCRSDARSNEARFRRSSVFMRSPILQVKMEWRRSGGGRA